MCELRIDTWKGIYALPRQEKHVWSRLWSHGRYEDIVQTVRSNDRTFDRGKPLLAIMAAHERSTNREAAGQRRLGMNVMNDEMDGMER